MRGVSKQFLCVLRLLFSPYQSSDEYPQTCSELRITCIRQSARGLLSVCHDRILHLLQGKNVLCSVEVIIESPRCPSMECRCCSCSISLANRPGVFNHSVPDLFKALASRASCRLVRTSSASGLLGFLELSKAVTTMTEVA